MSQTEIHIGKLRRIELNESLESFYKRKLGELNITELRSYHNNWEDAFKDEFNEKYFIINNTVFEIFNHIEMDESDDIYDIKKNEDGTYSFIMKFYNGGTCLSECIEEGLEEILK